MKAFRKPQGGSPRTYRAAIDALSMQGSSSTTSRRYDYRAGIDDVIDSIEELLKVGYALEVIDLRICARRGRGGHGLRR